MEDLGSLKELESPSLDVFPVRDRAASQYKAHVGQPNPDNASRSTLSFHVQVIYNTLAKK